jgi:hypothetical protein
MDLDSIIEVFSPVLAKEGVLILSGSIDGWSVLQTTLYDTESKTSVVSDFAITNQDPQKRWAEITYGRRYNLQQLLNIQAEDDDGNKSSGDNFKAKEDDKPWFSQTNLEWLVKVMGNFWSLEECLKKVREKYKVSNRAKDAIFHAYETWEIMKI